MKAIPLRNRRAEVVTYALVDDDDFAWLSQWRWYWRPQRGSAALDEGYVQRGEDRRTIQMHRQIMGFPEGLVDHKNGDGRDNRRANLRVATYAQNAQNRNRDGRRPGRDSSRHRGVSWYAPLGKWVARVRLNYELHHLGYYEDEDEAARVAAAFRAEHMPFSGDARATA